jgi:hypothetical protein
MMVARKPSLPAILSQENVDSIVSADCGGQTEMEPA